MSMSPGAEYQWVFNDTGGVRTDVRYRCKQSCVPSGNHTGLHWDTLPRFPHGASSLLIRAGYLSLEGGTPFIGAAHLNRFLDSYLEPICDCVK